MCTRSNTLRNGEYPFDSNHDGPESRRTDETDQKSLFVCSFCTTAGQLADAYSSIDLQGAPSFNSSRDRLAIRDDDVSMGCGVRVVFESPDHRSRRRDGDGEALALVRVIAGTVVLAVASDRRPRQELAAGAQQIIVGRRFSRTAKSTSNSRRTVGAVGTAWMLPSTRGGWSSCTAEDGAAPVAGRSRRARPHCDESYTYADTEGLMGGTNREATGLVQDVGGSPPPVASTRQEIEDPISRRRRSRLMA